jgi:NADH-quinone oxidoreductase subunit H
MEFLINQVIIPLVMIVVVVGVTALIMAYLTLMERRVLGFVQSRLGPNRVGPQGLLQPIADGVKLMLKEDTSPDVADKWIFTLAPIISFIPPIALLAVIPFGTQWTVWGTDITVNLYITDINVAVLYMLAISSIGIYGLILGGWASNSKYPLLGALRSAAQMVSYEVGMGLSIIGVLMIAGSLSLVDIVNAQKDMGVWFFIPQCVGFFIFIVSMFAETNRHPFDLPEAENELVAGYFTEYSGMRFALFYLAEYFNMIIVSSVAITLFLGGWMRPFPNVAFLSFLDIIPSWMWFVGKLLVFIYCFIWVRSTFPRYRYDQLMRLGWKWLIPLALINILVTGLVMILID